MSTGLTAAPTVARIDLSAIAANLAAVRERVGDRLVLAAVKADGYGHGAVPVSQMLEHTGAADWLGVATVGEGARLRAAGIGLPILKFGPTRGPAVVEALRQGLTLTVVDEQSVREASAAARGGPPVAVHLKVDTGMRRVGAEPADAPALAGLIDDLDGLFLDGLYSHLPIADSPDGDDFTSQQVGRFLACAAAVEGSRGPVRLKHLANSAGVLAHPDSWLDLVRPGIMIYGSYPDPQTPQTVSLRPTLRLSTELSFVKPIAAGESVGYGRSWIADRDTWIGTIPTGYGDGYSRLLSNCGRVLIGGQSYPIAGRVCMDQTMVDLGPDPHAGVGDEVVLIGQSGAEEITVGEVAALMGTIPYEVTCLFTGRIERSYG